MATKKKAPAAQKKVGKVMHEFKTGELKSGRSGKKVTNPKQAIAIGLSEARQAGAKVPPAKKKAASKKATAKKAAPKKATPKKAAVKKAAVKKAAPKKKAAAKKSGKK
jgi:hypothetical protein